MGMGFDYTKLIIENINKIIPAVLLLITGLTSAFGYVITDNWNNEEEKNQAIHEVTAGFQAVLTEKTEKPQILIPTYEKPRKPASCGNCIKRIEKLERWHE